MQRSATKVNRMECGGETLQGRHSAQARKKRKRLLSKRRRAQIKAEDARPDMLTKS